MLCEAIVGSQQSVLMEYCQNYSTNNVYDMQLAMKSRRHTICSPKPQHTVWNKMSDGEIGEIQGWL